MSRPKPSAVIRDLFASRLKLAMGELSPTDLARRLESDQEMALTQQAISNYLKGESVPKSDVLYGLSKFFGKSMDWFFGEPDKAALPPPELHIQETPTFKAFSENHHFSKENYIPIRLLKDDIAAGAPSEIREWDVEGWALIYASKEWMPHDPENYTCCHVQGYSMWPILAPGDIVAIDHAEKDPEVLNNKMVAFKVNGGATVKWLRYFPEKGVVLGDPENRDEKDSTIVLKVDEARENIVGKVAWWWAKR